MRSEKTIYYDLSDYNASQQANRIVAIVVGVVLLLGSAGWIVFSYMCLPTISKKKKKK